MAQQRHHPAKDPFFESCLCPNSEDEESRMGITILSLQSILLPLQSLAAWFAGVPAGAHGANGASGANSAVSSRASVHEARRCAPSVPQRRPHGRPTRALRVVRVLESSQASRGAGRMVISGRMADVCAELERLAALEAAAG
jgi:hypothetical protein